MALRAVMQGDLRVFDPIWTTANITAYHGTMIYDMLFGIDEQFRPQPQMVGRHSLSDDKLTYTFELRDGLGWQDGTPVTAADCVASLRRWMVRNAGGQAMQQVLEDVSAKDDRTFVIALKEPFGLLLDLLASPITPLCFMMRKKDAETDPFQQITARIGSGPFVFNEKASRPGNRYIYDKWGGYVPRPEPARGLAGGKVVHLDQVVWENIADEQTATAALQAGEIDFYELPPIDLLPQLQSNPDIKVVVLNQSGNIGIMRMNCLHPPFESVYARQAMLHLVDQSDFLKASFGNPKYYRTCASFFACGNPMQTDANTGWFKQGVDLAQAKELFKKGGYSGEPVLVLDATNVAFMNNSAQLISGQLQKIGVDAQLATSDWGGVVTRRAVMKPDNEGGWDIFITWGSSYGFGNPIASNPLTANGKKGWYGWPSNDDYEKLRMQWATAPDEAARTAIAVKMATVGWDFVPQVLLGQWVSPAAMRKDVNGFIGIPNVIPFWNVTKG
ncbi:MAG TPA: ABC transporter substrate-binding protein [Acetobacteraceae bacterium]|nr:ABC transporter substrate-binding protein [Acetobacteraceae bacterium]